MRWYIVCVRVCVWVFGFFSFFSLIIAHSAWLSDQWLDISVGEWIFGYLFLTFSMIFHNVWWHFWNQLKSSNLILCGYLCKASNWIQHKKFHLNKSFFVWANQKFKGRFENNISVGYPFSKDNYVIENETFYFVRQNSTTAQHFERCNAAKIELEFQNCLCWG